jgi:hypothetical protein
MCDSGASALNRLTQPLHREFDIGRLQTTPAFDLCLAPILWVAFYYLASFLAAMWSLVNFSRMKGSLGMLAIPLPGAGLF